MKPQLKKNDWQYTEKNEYAHLLNFAGAAFSGTTLIEFWDVEIFDRGLHGEIRRTTNRSFVIPVEFQNKDKIDMLEVRKFRQEKAINIAVNLAKSLEVNTYVYKQEHAYIVTEDPNEFEQENLYFVVLQRLLTSL